MWGIGNQTWIALLTFIPVFGFIWIFVLGVKGNQWAWEKSQWDSFEQFKKVQGKWAIVGFAVWGVLIAIGIAVILSVTTALHHGWVGKKSLS